MPIGMNRHVSTSHPNPRVAALAARPPRPVGRNGYGARSLLGGLSAAERIASNPANLDFLLQASRNSPGISFTFPANPGGNVPGISREFGKAFSASVNGRDSIRRPRMSFDEASARWIISRANARILMRP